MFSQTSSKFIYWSPKSLPNGPVSEWRNSMACLTLAEFEATIFDRDVYYYEDSNDKIYNPGIIPTNETMFIDLDHIDEHYDKIIKKMDELMLACPFIIMAKQSRSRSLHFICYGPWVTEENFVERDMFYLACIAKAILDITGIDLRNVPGALDKHTKSSNQRLFVYDPRKHPYWINPYPTMVEIDDKAWELYPSLRPIPEIHAEVEEAEFQGVFIPKVRKPGEKITLDRNFNIAGYTGNDARWRVANAILYLCKGDKKQAKQVIKDNFNNPSDFAFTTASIKTNHLVMNWVLMNLENKSQTLEKYLLDEIENVISFFQSHQRMLLVAPTGTGKTTLVNGKVDTLGLAKRLNAVVITPFNSMLGLYPDMTCIGSGLGEGGKANINDYKDDEPCVIIWDQAIKLKDKLKERVIIFDESHTLFLDRSYRDSAVQLMKILKDNKKGVIAITATPTGEVEELGLEKLEYKTKKGLVNTQLIQSDSNAGVMMLGNIMYNLTNDRYSRIVVFSDTYTRTLHENLQVKMIDHSFIHSKNRKGVDFKELQDTERLTKKVTLCTSLAFNGLNFKNEDENILVLMDVKEGETLAANIIQCVGRIRNSSVDLIAYMIPEGEKSSVDDRALKANLLSNKVDSTLATFDIRLINPDVVSALKGIESYRMAHATKPVIIDELGKTGYFVVKEVVDKKQISGRLRLKEKLDIEKIWREGFVNPDVIIPDTVKENDYYRSCESQWRNLAWNYSMPIEIARKILAEDKPDKLASTTLETMRKKCIVNNLSDEAFKKMLVELESVKRRFSEDNPNYKQLASNIKDMKKWRKEQDTYNTLHGGVECGEQITVDGDMIRFTRINEADLCVAVEETARKRSEGHSIKHKQHKQHKQYKKKLYRCEDGFEGTVEEIAEHTGKGVSTIKRYISNGSVVKV